MRVAVVVLGDLGRSPRMLYHALALADGVGDVDLVGYVETALDGAVASHPRIRVHTLSTPARRGPGPLFVLHGALRVVRQAITLLRLLLGRVERPDVLLVQNPPAVPTLLVALIAARARRARLIVDWHNFGWAMLALRLGARHPVVRLARGHEHAIGRRADAHLCVSRAMAAELAAHGIAGAVVLHDLPAERFAPTPEPLRHALLARLAGALRLPELSHAPALVVSPTGFTADEDVGLLIEAAERYDAAIGRDGAAFPDLLIVVTGTGPLRDHWASRMAALRLRRVHMRALWLETDDYPVFLGAADLGVSVHRSSSGLDLPMKIADLLGAGVPVCALDYGTCLAEVMRDGENGLLFATGAELAAQLETLFRGFPDEADLLAGLRRNVAHTRDPRWRDAWTAAARPLFVSRSPA
jgi:beta-1,4-mannosyltransferase